MGAPTAGVQSDGGVPAKVGATQRCLLTASDGSAIAVTATVTAVQGDDVGVDVNADVQPA